MWPPPGRRIRRCRTASTATGPGATRAGRSRRRWIWPPRWLATTPGTCVLVDCLTLWLTNALTEDCWPAEREALLAAVAASRARLLLVSNEVGSGVVPMGALSRTFVDEAGRLHQRLPRPRPRHPGGGRPADDPEGRLPMNDWLLRPTAAIDPTARAAARARQRQLTKPPGAPGRPETLAEDFAGWQGRAVPRLERVDVCVFAADHGVAARGVRPFRRRSPGR